MPLVVDAGGWIALGRGARGAWDLYRDALRAQKAPIAHAGIVV